MRIAVAGGTGHVGTTSWLRPGSAVTMSSCSRAARGSTSSRAPAWRKRSKGVDAVIDVVSVTTLDAGESVAFFEATTRTLLAAEAQAGSAITSPCRSSGSTARRRATTPARSRRSASSRAGMSPGPSCARRSSTSSPSRSTSARRSARSTSRRECARSRSRPAKSPRTSCHWPRRRRTVARATSPGRARRASWRWCVGWPGHVDRGRGSPRSPSREHRAGRSETARSCPGPMPFWVRRPTRSGSRRSPPARPAAPGLRTSASGVASS